MRDENNGAAGFAADIRQQLLHDDSGLRVKRSERLVHQQNFRLVGQRSGDGRSLLHAAGELIREGGFKTVQPDKPDIFHGSFRAFLLGNAAHFKPEFYVLQHSQPGEEAISLKDHSSVLPGPADFFSRHIDAALCRLVKPAEDVEQGGFSAARRAYYDDEFSFLYGKGDVVKREYRTVLPVKSSGNVFCSEFFHVASVAQPPVPRHQYPGQKTEQEVRREADKADHQQAHENHIRCEEALAL